MYATDFGGVHSDSNLVVSLLYQARPGSTLIDPLINLLNKAIQAADVLAAMHLRNLVSPVELYVMP